jgi:hypothetical protein
MQLRQVSAITQHLGVRKVGISVAPVIEAKPSCKSIAGFKVLVLGE